MEQIRRVETLQKEEKDSFRPYENDGPAEITDIRHLEQGTEMYMKGFKHPYKGFPDERIVEIIKVVKKIVYAGIRYLAIKPILITFGILFFFSKPLMIKVMHAGEDFFVGVAFPAFKRYRLNPKRYSPCVRELYRLMSLAVEREQSEAMKEKFRRIRDILCLILEYDSAYRFRFQDIISEIDLKAVSPDEGDEYYLKMRPDYDFGGREFGARKKELDDIQDDWQKEERKKESERNEAGIEFNKELNEICKKYEVELEPVMTYNKKLLSPTLSLKLLKPCENQEEYNKKLDKITPEFDKEFQELCKKHNMSAQVFLTPPPGNIEPGLRFLVKDKEVKVEG